MIIKDNFKKVLEFLNFKHENEIYSKKFNENCELKVDFKNEKLIYPEKSGFKVNERQTCNFKQNENFVVFECVHRLLNQGYNPKHIELEPKWKVGHGASGGRADILVKDNEDKALLIIECKTAGNEFKKAWNSTQTQPTQLFSYVQQVKSTKFISLYASDFVDGKVVSNYYLINVSDNKELLKNNPKLKSYKDATTAEEIYQVWTETYSKEYATVGLFENNKPYEIGKTKFNIDDLKIVTSKDIQGKYNEFATILRQHNVSGRENAFDKLVNLFLCKVTDEINNPDELQFYWKGKAYDDPFDFQDRLQKLYKIGMDKFLEDEITYIDNSLIDKAFCMFKDRENETKRVIKQYLKEQKFFTNNDFAFIDVHNEKLFYKNFEVLLKIARMIQDINLTKSDENQFLGDMFEGFLDQGVKQSEGQFFTPMPIVKFIINSLPKKENPKVIDYACGAGHFLNEYASSNKNSEIFGIEKEYRLSKVAKVSSFMYGNEVTIIYDDALRKIDKIKNNSFDVLIANPPYSVKGFLETLSDEEREKYELIKTIDEKSFSVNNSIECFFIERAKQLLKEGGIAGIIVPSSILNKGNHSINSNKKNIYIKTREIILKHFEIIAISEFGSGTFGKTGTNTVTLFLKRKGEMPSISNHLKNMVDTWGDCEFEINKVFKDDNLFEKYCNYIEIDYEVYKSLFCDELDEKLFDNETFKEYKNSFEKLTSTKDRKKRKQYKELSKEEKEAIEKKELINYIREIEKDKFYYFCIAYKNRDVIIVKSPTKSSENKKFLGYEWSSAKGNEGIKYISNSIAEIDESLEEEDKRVVENLQGLRYINTPLYNPNNSNDTTKINKIIKDNFMGIKREIPADLEQFVSCARLVDMLDFSRVDFNKALSLTPIKREEIIETKYPLVRLGEVVDLLGGFAFKSEDYVEYSNTLNLRQANIRPNGILNLEYKKIFLPDNFCVKYKEFLLKDGDIVIAMTDMNKELNLLAIPTIVKTNGYNLLLNQRVGKFFNFNLERLIPSYLNEILKSNLIRERLKRLGYGNVQSNLSKSDLLNIKIPLPLVEIQNKIVNECQKIDDEVENAKNTIEKNKNEIKKEFNLLNENASNSYRLSNDKIFKVFIGKRVLSKEIQEERTEGTIVVYSANVFEPFGYIKKDLIKDFSKDSIIWGIDGDWMVNYIQKNNPFYPTDHCGVLRVDDSKINPIYLKYSLEQEGMNKRFSRTHRASIDRIKSLIIKVPSIKEQNEFANKVMELESENNRAKKIIENSKQRKEEILKNYL
jgi:type I restriction enzyme M protein